MKVPEGAGNALRPRHATRTTAQLANPAIPLRAPAAAAVEAREPASPRVSSLRAGWRWLVRVNRRIEDSWVGDLIGAVSLFAMLWIGLVAAAVFE